MLLEQGYFYAYPKIRLYNVIVVLFFLAGSSRYTGTVTSRNRPSTSFLMSYVESSVVVL